MGRWLRGDVDTTYSLMHMEDVLGGPEAEVRDPDLPPKTLHLQQL